MTEVPFQDQIPNIHCFGCGADNQMGLRIKSTWCGDGESICLFQPLPHHAAGPSDVVNGGIIATVTDCHSVCTAIADGYKRAGRAIGEGKFIEYATGTLNIRYMAPAPLGPILEFRATIIEVKQKTTTLTCVATADGKPIAKGKVIAVRVPDDWRDR